MENTTLKNVLRNTRRGRESGMATADSPAANQPLLISRQETAELLGICLKSVDTLLAAGELRPVRIGRRVMVVRSSVFAITRRAQVPTGGAEVQ